MEIIQKKANEIEIGDTIVFELTHENYPAYQQNIEFVAPYSPILEGFKEEMDNPAKDPLVKAFFFKVNGIVSVKGVYIFYHKYSTLEIRDKTGNNYTWKVYEQLEDL